MAQNQCIEWCRRGGTPTAPRRNWSAVVTVALVSAVLLPLLRQNTTRVGNNLGRMAGCTSNRRTITGWLCCSVATPVTCSCRPDSSQRHRPSCRSVAWRSTSHSSRRCSARCSCVLSSGRPMAGSAHPRHGFATYFAAEVVTSSDAAFVTQVSRWLRSGSRLRNALTRARMERHRRNAACPMRHARSGGEGRTPGAGSSINPAVLLPCSDL